MKTINMNEEWFPVVNQEGSTIGKASRSACHSGSKILHPVIHLHILDEEGKYYLQKRSEYKDIQPGKWDTAVGGHINYGEPVINALYREAKEELGIKSFTPVFLFRYIFESEIEKELVYSFQTTYTGPIQPDLIEVQDGRFWSPDEILENIKLGVFTPNFQFEFTKLTL